MYGELLFGARNGREDRHDLGFLQHVGQHDEDKRHHIEEAEALLL